MCRHPSDLQLHADVYDGRNATQLPVQQHPEQHLLGYRHHDYRRLWRHHPRHRSWEIPFRLCHANRLHNYCRTDRDRICLHDERLQTQKRQRMSQLPSLRTRRQCRVLQILRTSSESVRNRRGKEINFTTYAERNARIKQ